MPRKHVADNASWTLSLENNNAAEDNKNSMGSVDVNSITSYYTDTRRHGSLRMVPFFQTRDFC